MNKPLVSIIVTCYNRADMVARALDSVYVQTYRPLELVIVDDGSRDNSMEVINAWKAAHPDGNGFTCKAQTFPNGKLCVARNRGIEMSTGEFIQYVDDDDWLYPFAVEEKMRAAEAHLEWDVIVNQVDYCYSRIGIQGHSHLTVPTDPSRQLLHVLDTANETYFSPTLMFRRNVLSNCGAWTPGLLFADDIDIVVRLAVNDARFGLVDKSLSVYNMHGELRQCNNMIYRLADDFWPDLFLRLYASAQQSGKDSPDVRNAFDAQCRLYGIRLLRQGKFSAAERTFSAGEKISGRHLFRMVLPFPLRRTAFVCEYVFFAARDAAKCFIKKMIRR